MLSRWRGMNALGLRRHLSTMAASVPFIRRHLILLDPQGNGETWPKKLEETDHPIAGFHQAAEPLNGGKDPKKLAITAAYPVHSTTNLASKSAGHDVLVFPDNIRVSNVQSSDVDFLISHLLEEHVDMNALSSRLDVSPLTGRHVLVCAHAKRDFRCACAGPKLIQWFQDKQPADWTVYASSHFGGHRFAGNCIIYPDGHWYGLVNSPEDVDTLLTAVLETKELVVPSLWRGCLGETKAKQLEMFEKAKSS